MGLGDTGNRSEVPERVCHILKVSMYFTALAEHRIRKATETRNEAATPWIVQPTYCMRNLFVSLVKTVYGCVESG